MEDVTDTAFRRLIARIGRPDVFFTEFIHTTVVLARRAFRPGVTPRLAFSDEERPLVAQIWGNDPEQYARASARLAGLGFDGIDINMGCPVRKIRKKGACSALILQPALAAELIAAAKGGGLPVSVKTRIGFGRVSTEEWIGFLLEQGLDALTVHGRTAAQDDSVPADWDEIGRSARLAREMGARTAVLGNGDIMSRLEVREKCERYGLDGAMVGRGIFSNPHLFAGGPGFGELTACAKLDLLVDHVTLHRDVWSGTRNYEILKKFYKVYLRGFPAADAIRDELNRTHDYEAALRVVESWYDAV